MEGGVDQRLLGLSTAAPPEKPKSNPHRDSESVWKSHSKRKVTGRAEQ